MSSDRVRPTPQRPAPQRPPRKRAPKGVNSELEAWGDYHAEQVLEEQGWNRFSPLWSPDTFSPSFESRILAGDMPARIRRVDLIIAQLPSLLQDIAKAKYWFHRWPEGHHLAGREIYNSDRAAWFDMGVGWFNKQVRTLKRLVLQGMRA